MAVVVAALGYFVDIYDLVLFAVVRRDSLTAIGGTGPAATADGFWGTLQLELDIALGRTTGSLEQAGAALFAAQMTGLLLGGFLWGILGDRRGRLTVLFGSILLYSVANIGNAFVGSVPAYALMRLLAGVGLAGELGAGITLVSEHLPTRLRGYGTMIVATVGLAGAVAAGLTGQWFGQHVSQLMGGALGPWQVAYLMGGGMGLALLALRVGVAESGLYETSARRAGSASSAGSAGSAQAAPARQPLRRGAVWMLFWPPKRGLRYVCILLMGVPIWFVGGILFVFAPEIGESMGLVGAAGPKAGLAVIYGYAGAVVGDCLSGLLSQWMKSRLKVVSLFMVGIALGVACTLSLGSRGANAYYLCIFLTGLATGYWALFVTVAAESFGTNLRATAATTAPNLVRGSAVLITMAWETLQHAGQTAQEAAGWVGAVCLILGLTAVGFIPETFSTSLDYQEH